MKAISLFSGMGGDSLAIKNCGLDLISYSEKEKKFCQQMGRKKSRRYNCESIFNC